MLPGFGYRFLRQRRQHSGPSIDSGTTAFDCAISTVALVAAEGPCGKIGPVAPDASGPKMPGINLRRAHRKAREAFVAVRFLTVFLGQDQGKQTFA
jgi:hypothetical protein